MSWEVGLELCLLVWGRNERGACLFRCILVFCIPRLMDVVKSAQGVVGGLICEVA